MILKALYDYYFRLLAIGESLPPLGFKEQEIHFVFVIDEDGRLLNIEDMRDGNGEGKTFYVVDDSRSSNIKPYMMYDNGVYVLNLPKDDSNKEIKDAEERHNAFVEACRQKGKTYPANKEFAAIVKFYENGGVDAVKAHQKWPEITKKGTAIFSFRLKGRRDIAAWSEDLRKEVTDEIMRNAPLDTPVCIVTGERRALQESFSPTPIFGGRSNGVLVSFQENSGYDSYGHKKGFNAPISKLAGSAIAISLRRLTSKKSLNNFTLGNRTFVFWTSASKETQNSVINSLNGIMNLDIQEIDDPDKNAEKVRADLMTIYNGLKSTESTDMFYFLGLVPNEARIYVVYWMECPLVDFIFNILKHFDDMKIINTRSYKKPYAGLMSIFSSVKVKAKDTDEQQKKRKDDKEDCRLRNTYEAVMKSILQNLPYPASLFNLVIRRIRSELKPPINTEITRIAIIKAYLNRLPNNNKQKITVMLNEKETNIGYLLGRLFAVFEYVQIRANRKPKGDKDNDNDSEEDNDEDKRDKVNTIRTRYINSASSTPAIVFPTLFSLSSHHLDKLDDRYQTYFEKIKQGIVDMLPSSGIPSHLALNDQGRFFVGYYHQKQELYTSANQKKKDNNK